MVPHFPPSLVQQSSLKRVLWRLLELLGLIMLLIGIIVAIWDIFVHTQNLVTIVDLNIIIVPDGIILVIVAILWSELIFHYFYYSKQLSTGSFLQNNYSSFQNEARGTSQPTVSDKAVTTETVSPNPTIVSDRSTPVYSEIPIPPHLTYDDASNFKDPVISHISAVSSTRVTKVACFNLPKGGETVGDDRWEANVKLDRYAVTDGVARSFESGSWAGVIAKSYVDQEIDFCDDNAFMQWLMICSQCWEACMTNTWLPLVTEQRLQEGKNVLSPWNEKMLHQINQGAQTTLIGCSLNRLPGSEHLLEAHVLAIGDAEFFLFRRISSNTWEMIEKYPYTSSREFKPKTSVLATQKGLWRLACQEKKCKTIKNLQSGDLIVLASDAIGEWILRQQENKNDDWMVLLTEPNSAKFQEMIQNERMLRRIKEDDATMMIIQV